jgi:AcrR family transcriptional regulator
VAAAIDLGIDAFSLQAIAERLGVTAPALYSHVAGRDEVVELAEAAVRDQLHGFASDAQDWRGWLVDFATNVRDAHGPAGRLRAFDGRADGADLLAGEPGLRLLLEAGFDEVDAASAVWLTYRVAVTAEPERAGSFGRFVHDTGDLLGASTTAVDAPATRAVQRALADGPPDTFAFDLEVVLDGIAARLDRPPARPTDPRRTRRP